MEDLVEDKFWQDRRVFVTGASGLIGGWLVDALCQQGADVVALVRDWVPSARLLNQDCEQQATLVSGDLSCPLQLERILAEYEIQTVFHLAAQTIVPIANQNPLSTFESNIAGTWRLLEACRHIASCDAIVVASSDKAYGDATMLPYKETLPLNAIYPYDVSKACADMISQSYAKTFALPVAVTRCGNFFGGGDLNWNRIVPGTIRSIVRAQAPVIRSTGQLIRDYIYVEDAVSAYLTLAKQLSHNPSLKGEAFNFSNGNQQSVLEMTQKILKIMHSDLEPVVLGQEKGEIQDQHLDSTKAEQMLAWHPQFGLSNGLIKTIAWYQSYFNHQSRHQG